MLGSSFDFSSWNNIDMLVFVLQVIRHYHGHLSGVYSLALHPTLDVMMTGGRDSVCRVWDMRTKLQVHCLTGHQETVCSILTSRTDPQVCPGLSLFGKPCLISLRFVPFSPALCHLHRFCSGACLCVRACGPGDDMQ